MQTRERRLSTNSANSEAGNNANRPAGDGRKQEPYLNGHTGKNGGGEDGGLFVATKQTPGGGGGENSPTNRSREPRRTAGLLLLLDTKRSRKHRERLAQTARPAGGMFSIL